MTKTRIREGTVPNHLPDPRKRDWHTQRNQEEPRCFRIVKEKKCPG